MWPVWAELRLFGRVLPLTGYGVFAILAAALGTYVAIRLARRLGFPAFDAFAASALAVAFGLIGAKLLFILVSLPRLEAEGLYALLTHGGLVWYGGVVGGAAAVYLYVRAYRLDVGIAAEIAAPALAVGHAFGRMGCFAAGCCHGRESTLPWAVKFSDSPYFSGPVGVPLHPVQLYEAGAELALAGLLYAIAGKGRPGRSFGIWLVGYGTVRLVMELGFRGDDRGVGVFGLPPSVTISVLAMVIGSVVVMGRRREV